jgi:hypothetical protein
VGSCSICDEKAIASLVFRWFVKKINILSKVSNLNTLKKSVNLFFLKEQAYILVVKKVFIFENFTV